MGRVNEIMADHIGFFAAEPGSSFDEMIAYVDTYRDPFGVELICATVHDTKGFISSVRYQATTRRSPQLPGPYVTGLSSPNGHRYSIQPTTALTGGRQDVTYDAPCPKAGRQTETRSHSPRGPQALPDVTRLGSFSGARRAPHHCDHRWGA